MTESPTGLFLLGRYLCFSMGQWVQNKALIEGYCVQAFSSGLLGTNQDALQKPCDVFPLTCNLFQKSWLDVDQSLFAYVTSHSV